MSRNPGFRSIMVPVDGSQLAEGAIRYAIAIAERGHTKVRFVLVHPDKYPPLLIEPATVYLKELTQRFRKRLDVSLSAIILNGRVAPSLAKHAQEIGADLVVMTTHGLGGLRRAWLGSVADQLIRTTEIPLIVVRPHEDGSLPAFDPREILLPLDGSLLAETALEPAARLAKLWDAEISLLQVVAPATEAYDPAPPLPIGSDDELTALRRQSAQDYLGDVADRLRMTGVRASGVAVAASTSVPQTILELGKPERIGLIAMATHGRGGLNRLVLGSVTDKMVRAAEVPLLVVPITRAARQVAKVQRRMMRALRLRKEISYA